MKHNNAECNKMSYAYIQHLVFHLIYFFCEYNASVSLIKPQALCWSGKLIWGSMDPEHTSVWTSSESFCPKIFWDSEGVNLLANLQNSPLQP